MPAGHALPEYVRHRYGRAMYAGTLAIMAFYLFVALSAQVTGMAFLVRLVADVPLWATAGVVLGATGAYTALGGLRASVVTDGVQAGLLLPLLAGGAALALWKTGGPAGLAGGVAEQAPELLRWSFAPGLQGGAALVIGIGAASLFNQGTWQRVYAAEGMGSLRTGFFVVAGVMAGTVGGTGLLGLAAVGEGAADPASTALFNLLLEGAPPGVGIGVIVLGLTLVMSSADTVLNALGSLGTVALRELRPEAGSSAYLRAARWTPVVLALPVYAIAAQGISVLYLFLIADLVCAAALVPVFGGLFSTRITNRAAVVGTTAGLVVGGLLFPAPGAAQPALLPAFAAALLVPAATVGLVTIRSDAPAFDFATLRHKVTTMEE
jgi:Na+/proline symporter